MNSDSSSSRAEASANHNPPPPGRLTTARAWLLALVLAPLVAAPVRAESPLTVDELVELALKVNPQVRAARARWYAAVHSINQNYAPADPTFSFGNLDSPTTGFDHASQHALQLTQPLQFPGKSLLQGESAKRRAEIARLGYQAASRDIRAQVESGYYQVVLDSQLIGVTAESIDNLRRLLQVTQVAYSANRVTQADFIAAEVELTAAQQQQRELQTAEANDETLLNQLLSRPPAEPLPLDKGLELKPIESGLDPLVALAGAVRQEILQAALSEHNAATALELARMQYLPDYSLSYIFNHYLLTTAAPSPTRTQVHGVAIGFNLPLYFWLKQNENVKEAGFDLEAAREDFSSVRNQTAAQVTMLFRSARLGYRAALLYRDSLIPLARQGFEVALVAYQGGKLDFVALSTALKRSTDARVAYLQAAYQFLAQRVALEQAIGGPLPR